MELKMADEDFTEEEAIVAGAILLMLTLRARLSDFRAIEQVTVTQKVIEIEVKETKTSRKVSQRLPVTLRGASPLGKIGGPSTMKQEFAQASLFRPSQCSRTELRKVGEPPKADWWTSMRPGR